MNIHMIIMMFLFYISTVYVYYLKFMWIRVSVYFYKYDDSNMYSASARLKTLKIYWEWKNILQFVSFGNDPFFHINLQPVYMIKLFISIFKYILEYMNEFFNFEKYIDVLCYHWYPLSCHTINIDKKLSYCNFVQ